MLNIGDRLKAERLRLGFNQSDFAERAGVSKTTQFNYEKNDRSPDADYLAEIGKAGVDLMYVLTGQRSLAAADGFSAEAVQIMGWFDHLAEEDRAVVTRVLRALADTQKT